MTKRASTTEAEEKKFRAELEHRLLIAGAKMSKVLPVLRLYFCEPGFENVADRHLAAAIIRIKNRGAAVTPGGLVAILEAQNFQQLTGVNARAYADTFTKETLTLRLTVEQPLYKRLNNCLATFVQMLIRRKKVEVRSKKGEGKGGEQSDKDEIKP